MLFNIHKKSEYSQSAISYNEEKILIKTAKVVSLNNMKCRSSMGIIIALQRLEETPTGTNVKNRGFHLSINPADGEEMTDKKAAELAKNIMNDLGYSEQPWIMYKHFDIDRIHYHIVSTRIKKDGHLIPNDNDRYKIREIGKKYEQKYGYIYGKSNQRRALSEEIKRFEPGKKFTTERIVEIINYTAKNYNFKNIYDYSKLLESLGVKIGRIETRDGQNHRWLFRGLDENGTPCTKYIGKIDDIDPANGKIGLEKMIQQIGENKTIEKPSVERQEKILKNTMKALKYAKGAAVPENTFKNFMSTTGLDITFERNETTKEIEDIVIVDHETKQVLNNEDMDYLFNIAMLNESLPFRESKKYKKRARLKEPSIKDLVKQNLQEIKQMAKDVAQQYKEAFQKEI